MTFTLYSVYSIYSVYSLIGLTALAVSPYLWSTGKRRLIGRAMLRTLAQ
jgi:hypothetical protein